MKFLRMIRWGLHLALLALLAGHALADSGVVTPGGNLKKRAYQTYAAMTLYVDPTGSDSNACTASGTSACRTWAGVIGKVPARIRQNLIINLAAGTWAEALVMTGFSLVRDPTTSTSPSITINGTLAAPTLTGGTSSGTVTNYTAASGADLAIITDTGQAWIVNELRGSFVLMGSGTSSGSYFPIVSNTATTVTISYNGTIAAGNTYTLTAPASIFTSTAVYTGNVGAGNITTNNVRFQPASGAAFQVSQNNLGFNWTRCQFVAGNTSLLTADGNLRTLTFATSYLTSSLSTATCMFGATNTPFSITNSYFRASGANAVPFCVTTDVRVNQLTAHLEGSPVSESIIELFNGMHSGPQTAVTLHCLNVGSGIGFYAPHPGETSQGAGGLWGATKIAVKDCSTGIYINSPLELSATGITIKNCGTGIAVGNGGIVNLRANAPTYTTVTNELQVDGSNYTYSFFSGLSPASIKGYSGAAIVNQ